MGSIRPFERWVDYSCLIEVKCSGFIPLWLAFVGFTSLFFLKGRCMKKFGFFHKGFGFLKRNLEWLFAQQSLMILVLIKSCALTLNRNESFIDKRVK